MDALVRVALADHPTLRQMEARIRESMAKAPQRKAWPDPRLGIGLEAMPFWPARFDASPMTGLQFTLSQAIPWPSRLTLAARMEERGVAVERALLDEARVQLAAAIRLAAIEIAFTDGDRALAQGRAKVLDQIIGLVSERYRVQKATLADLLKVRLTRSRIEDQILQIARRRDAALARLNALVARPMDSTAPRVTWPEKPRALAPLADLVSRAERDRPLLASLRARVMMQRVRRQQARTGYYPDFALNLGYRYRQDSGMDAVKGQDFYSIGVSVSIPIFSIGRTRAAVNEAEAAISREEAAYRTALLAITRDLRIERDAIARLEAQRRLYEARILPEAKETLRASLHAYTSSQGDFLSLLDQERSFYEDQARLLGVRAQIAAAYERLRAALGAAPEGGRP